MKWYLPYLSCGLRGNHKPCLIDKFKINAKGSKKIFHILQIDIKADMHDVVIGLSKQVFFRGDSLQDVLNILEISRFQSTYGYVQCIGG